MTDSLLNQSVSDDVEIMQHVLRLASIGHNSVHPNPRVGAVIVNQGVVVGEGWHKAAGELHAERVALEQAADKARGATLYVNLEPCCHQGRTPPCSDAIIDAGITKVVAAMLDPNPLVKGGGFEMLRGVGIDVLSGVLEDQALWLNRGFVSRMRLKQPWVTLKVAATLDGRTADFDGNSKWITGESARHQVQHMRAASSAIITGIGTVLADDPEMTVRLDELSRQPLRVVLDNQLRLPIDARIIGDGGLVVFTTSQDISKIAELTELGVEVIQHEAATTTPLDLSRVLTDLAEWQCNEVLVEAGQTLSGSLLQAGLVDELILFYAGSILGDQGNSMFKFDHPLLFDDRAKYKVTEVDKIGDDLRVHAVKESSVNQLNEACE